MSGAELINKFAVYYNSSYSAMFNETENIVNGRIFEFVCPVDVEYFGFYIGPSNVLGSGNLLLELYNEIDSTIEPKIKAMSTDIAKKQDKIDRHTINVSFDGTSASGRTIDFSGLTAIKDALDSITDASETNRYTIHIEGVFRFTDPQTALMYGGNEYSAILMKDYVDIEGDGPGRSIIIMDFPANATFHSGKTYADYQPIYLRRGHKVSGLKFIGRNCRYAFHIETDGSQNVYNKEITVQNCDVIYLGHPDYNGSYRGVFGIGVSSGQTLNFINCNMQSFDDKAVFSVHTPLLTFDRIVRINLKGCQFNNLINFGLYQYENNMIVTIDDCIFNGTFIPRIVYDLNRGSAIAKNGNYINVLLQGNKLNALYECDSSDFNKELELKGAVLRIKSLSNGATSIVRFDETTSGFLAIVGNGQNTSYDKTIYGWDTNFGYVYRDGGANISGQAFGTIDVDENASNNTSLGKKLGDCITTNKVLKVTIDGTEYTITFNENYTSQPNSYVLGKINDVIGSVGLADVFSPAILYYPQINGLKNVLCVDENSILKGMGVVLTRLGYRRAKNSDGYIDGIALENIAENQYGRIITSGYIYNKKYYNATYRAQYFTTEDNVTTQMFENLKLGISATNDGVFDKDATPKLLQQVHSPLDLIYGNDFGAFKIL